MKFLHKLNYVFLILCLSCTAYANEVKEEKEIVDTEYQFTHEYMAKGEKWILSLYRFLPFLLGKREWMKQLRYAQKLIACTSMRKIGKRQESAKRM